MLTLENLRSTLVTIFGVDPKYIIPKQGNWWNAQELDPTIGTWIAYEKNDGRNRTMVMNDNSDISDGGPISTTFMKSLIKLQIVGNDAELLANTIPHWTNRYDVLQAWQTVGAQLFADNMADFTVSPFMQSGLNTVFAYNVSFYVLWQSSIQFTQSTITAADISGDLVFN